MHSYRSTSDEYLACSSWQDTWPWDREAEPFLAQSFHQLNIWLKSMVKVHRDVSCLIFKWVSWRMGPMIPHTLALAILVPCTLELGSNVNIWVNPAPGFKGLHVCLKPMIRTYCQILYVVNLFLWLWGWSKIVCGMEHALVMTSRHSDTWWSMFQSDSKESLIRRTQEFNWCGPRQILFAIMPMHRLAVTDVNIETNRKIGHKTLMPFHNEGWH